MVRFLVRRLEPSPEAVECVGGGFLPRLQGTHAPCGRSPRGITIWLYIWCHRMLNAVEPGTQVPIHRHPTKDESFVVLRGRVRVTTYNDDGSVIESVVLCQEDGRYGVDIKKGEWHNLESLEPDSVIWLRPTA